LYTTLPDFSGTDPILLHTANLCFNLNICPFTFTVGQYQCIYLSICLSKAPYMNLRGMK
jgi:hypothetical protein